MGSLAECDLVGFQTDSDLRAFRDYALYEAGGRINDDDTIEMFGRTLRAGAFPIGIDVEEMEHLAAAAESEDETRRLVESLGGRQLIIGVDRLDYSKGILGRIEAVGELLASRPDYRNRITLVQIAAPSRIDVVRYRKLRREIEGIAGRVNGKHAEIDWVPVRYLNRVFPRRQLAGFYRVARLGLVTPLRDGMNLVAKEYVAAQRAEDPGVLVLSRFAGAAREMSGALIVNPFDIVEMAEAIDRGLRMPLAERQERWHGLMDSLRKNDLATWSENFLDSLSLRHAAAA
jgi:trehalose 6-phosphate synthase